jgi:hypothetical protein
MGTIADTALQMLQQTLQAAMGPIDAAVRSHTLIGVSGAINITNRTLFNIGHVVFLSTATGADRCYPPVRNVHSSQVWIDAAQSQQSANIHSAIRSSMQSANPRGNGGGGGGAANNSSGGKGGKGKGKSKGKGGKGKGGNGSRGVKRQSTADQPVDNKTPKPEQASSFVDDCRHQATRDGCPFGLSCWFKHSDEHPKTDDTKRSSG